MTNDPFAGRDSRAPERCRMLVATEDGVFLWPGSALVYRRGNGFFTMDPREVNSELGAFFGPAALATPILTVLEIARDRLREGRTATVQRMLDRLPLPSLSPNGVRLTRAIAKRQRLALPDVASATELSGTVWTDSDVEIFAKLHDDLKPPSPRTREGLQPRFHVGLPGNRMVVSFGRAMGQEMAALRRSVRYRLQDKSSRVSCLAIRRKSPRKRRRPIRQRMWCERRWRTGWCARC
jgi:hypothetical protein